MSVTSSSPQEVAKAASISSKSLAVLPAEARNHALTAVHGALQSAKDSILAANAEDLEAATKAAAHGQLSPSVLKRLDLASKGKWEDMLQGILDVRDLDDPGEQQYLQTRIPMADTSYGGSYRSFAPQRGTPLFERQ